jgi:hypothetical protein
MKPKVRVAVAANEYAQPNEVIFEFTDSASTIGGLLSVSQSATSPRTLTVRIFKHDPAEVLVQVEGHDVTQYRYFD